MVAIVPNRTEIQGKIMSLEPDKKHKDFHAIELHLTKIMDDQEDRSLIDFEVNSSITVLVAEKVMKEYKFRKGMIISCIIRKASMDEYFIIPDSIHITTNE